MPFLKKSVGYKLFYVPYSRTHQSIIWFFFRTHHQILKILTRAKSYAASTNIASAVRKYQLDFPNLRK